MVTIGIEHAGKDFPALGALPCRPQPINQQSQYATNSSIEGALDNNRTGLDTGERNQEDNEFAYRQGEDSVMGGASPAKEEGCNHDEPDFDRQALGQEVEESGCKAEAGERAREAKDAP